MKLLSLTFYLTLVLLSGIPLMVSACEKGMYARAAQRPAFRGDAASSREFPSPDGRVKIIYKNEGENLQIFVRLGMKEFSVVLPPWPCPEFQWAPDSKAFYITYSEGGAVGNYKTLVIYPSKEGIKTVNPAIFAERDFLAHYPKCFEPETPNIGAIAWQGSSGRLLLAAEVLPHSNCDMMGTFTVYEVEVPTGRIIKKHNQLEAKNAYGELLGTELKNANDECFTKPGSCNIPQLHEGALKSNHPTRRSRPHP